MAGLLVVLLSGGSSAGPSPYPEGPPPAHTGGFGDPTCRACHFDHPLNEPGGSVEMEGLPPTYRTGTAYGVEVVLRREAGMERSGFQVTARIAGGAAAGARAGELSVESGRVERVVEPESGVAYLQQTLDGSEPEPGGGEARWRFTWVAPADDVGPVVFHVTANAGNDDASEFGDRIYADSVVVGGPGRAPRPSPPGS